MKNAGECECVYYVYSLYMENQLLVDGQVHFRLDDALLIARMHQNAHVTLSRFACITN